MISDDKYMMELPLDADGVPIRVGDVLYGYGKSIEVVDMRYGRSGWVLISRDGNGYSDTYAFTHDHTPTVEDVLRDFLDEAFAAQSMYVAESMDREEYEGELERITEKAAEEIRGMM